MGLAPRLITSGTATAHMFDGDVFQAAVMAGLISDIVHIRPSWATDKNGRMYESRDMAIGWFKPEQTRFHNKTRELCKCKVR